MVTGLIGILIRLRLIETNNFIARESTQIFKRFKGLSLLKYKLMYLLSYTVTNVLICHFSHVSTKDLNLK